MNISRNMLLATLVTLSFSAFASEGDKDAVKREVSQTQTDTSNKPAEGTEATDKKAKEGIISRAYSGVKTFVHFPLDVLDGMAGIFGTEKISKWLGSAKDKDGNELKLEEKGMITSFFAAHESAVSRSLTVAGTAAVVVAAYKVYQNFIVEDDADEEYADVDVFGDDSFDAETN